MKGEYNPFNIIINISRNRGLIAQLTKRQIEARYKGSYLGFLWSFINPIFMLTVYTFVFSIVFEARWGTENNNKIEFALLLFSGLIAYNIFSEVITSSPTLIINNTNFVKKVVFPLEIIPLASLISALVHGLISTLVLFVGILVLTGTIQWTIILLPVVLLPLLLLTIGISWFLSSIGVFLRDIGQVIGILVTGLLFLSPIFYPKTAVPEEFHSIIELNPISYVVEDMRKILVWGEQPNWEWLLIGTVMGLFVSYLGYAWFIKTKHAFADVL